MQSMFDDVFKALAVVIVVALVIGLGIGWLL
jgi:hypothetical protein